MKYFWVNLVFREMSLSGDLWVGAKRWLVGSSVQFLDEIRAVVEVGVDSLPELLIRFAASSSVSKLLEKICL